MYDVKNNSDFNINFNNDKDCLRCDCIGDRSYFQQIQYDTMFEFKTVHVPVENIIK